MRSFRLIVHQKNFSGEDLIINPKDYPGTKVGDILEIYHPTSPPEEEQKNKRKIEPEEEYPRLLLQIKAFPDESVQQNALQKDTISVEQSIAQAFGLQTYKNVTIRIVDPTEITLESIELTFKDQYMGRSEMWRLKNSLINTCVYMKKNIEFCGGTVRCQVYEMWAQGDRVACGVITDDTKVVFRSSTSMVYLFLQMSSEMWDFDIYGDLYFEKAVNGFLADLFMKWKKNGSNHEVTIVLFSRTFYEAFSLEEFPHHMRECLQKDYKGRYYEDFYRVAVQNERYDDWNGILVQLRRIFSEYLKIVLEYHKRPGVEIPSAKNSTATQGNFLEVLNMSLNVFEKHYLDRSFDRTGQLSVVITPGVGIFEVDRELTNITKQRIIDNGVGSDLVCVGEQPLHAVPLLKFHNKDTNTNVPDDYSMPHWINLSFYSTNKKIAYSTFVPRIKLPPFVPVLEDRKESPKKLLSQGDYIHNSFFDYDAYDSQVFSLPHHHPIQDTNPLTHHNHRELPLRFKRNSGNLMDVPAIGGKGSQRKMSDPDISYKIDSNARSDPIAIPPAACSPILSPHDDRELSPLCRMVVGSEGSPLLESKALINPFDPSHVTIKLTSNRRRWTHIFPKGPTGVLIQQHHYQAIPTAQSNTERQNVKVFNEICGNNTQNEKPFHATATFQEYCKKRPNIQTSSNHSVSVGQRNPSKSSTLLWGATGEQEWTPALTTGVDWKSLTIPACLPITTDYFPDKRALNIDYVVYLYSLLPDSVNADFALQRLNYKKPFTTTIEVFKELISQRLAQGFQLILMPRNYDNNNLTNTKIRGILNVHKNTEVDETYYLSIGRLFHIISLSGNTISVIRYRPRHPYPGFNYQYRYRFHAPHHDTYEESFASFTTEKLEHFNWNYMDHYVCTGGDTEFVLVDALKYWRFRIYLLPLNNIGTKKIIDNNEHCDIYTLLNSTEHQQMVDGLLKFIETAVNKIKRSTIKKPRMSLNNISNAPLVQPRRNSMSNFTQNVNCSSPFRERLGSNRLSDRPRPRSGSKVMDRNRSSQNNETQSSQETQLPDNNNDEITIQTGPCLKFNATNFEIIEAMKNPINGLAFITAQQSLPSLSFVAADAVNWLLLKMEGLTSIDKAVEKMKGLHNDDLIRHASSVTNRSFIYGFYLFFIVDKDCPDNYNFQSSIRDQDLQLQYFENEWMEVEIKSPLNWGVPVIQNTTTTIINNNNNDREIGIPHFLRKDIDSDYSEFDLQSPVYKRMRLETDVGAKSDRVEWGHVRYQTVFRPDQAYEIIVEWLTSSGSIIAELLSSWYRKAQTCGLQMIPIPHDPLALPYSNKSDPLRGPIFIPLMIKCLEERDQLFKEFKEDTALERLFLLQEAILQRFGFIHCLVDPFNNSVGSREHQYIHSTGTVFVLISSTTSKSRNRLLSSNKGNKSSVRYSVHADIVPSPHEAYITRHVSGKNKDDYDNSRKMGFLWSWNHMISRRWRTNQGVDNNFQTKLLKDFREFCANVDNRLRNFWEESWLLKEMASTSADPQNHLPNEQNI